MEPIVKTTRVTDAYSQIKEEIRSNRMPPGFQCPEAEVALRLGMSRTPVREALIRLEAEGMVELIPRRGMRVLPINADDMREIYELLTLLEPNAAASLARRRPLDEELKPLAQATEDMEAALDRDDLDAWADADDRFHRTLLRLHGNRRMLAFVSSLFDQAHRARTFTLRLRESPRKSTEEHREILENIRRGDAKATRESFVRHRKRAADELMHIIEAFKLPQL